jgi:nitroreductase
MDVLDAVATRYSCRAFLPTPVPEATVRDILARAARAPSGGNVQPWRVHALAGQKLEQLKALVRARPELLPRGEGAEYDIYPRDLKEPYETRRRQVGAALYQSIGVTREDRAGRYRQYARNFEFFGAPVGLLLSIDRSMGPPQWSDLGGYIQTVMLLAREHGLHTCGLDPLAQDLLFLPRHSPRLHSVLRPGARPRRPGRADQQMARPARAARRFCVVCRVPKLAVTRSKYWRSARVHRRALSLAHDLIRKTVPTFRDHARDPSHAGLPTAPRRPRARPRRAGHSCRSSFGRRSAG